jgi:hypothetical protein
MSGRSIIIDAIDGAVAGAVATWLMGKVTTALYEREATIVRECEDAARGGKTAYGVAAERLAAAVGEQLSDEKRKEFGENIHWALGVGAGAVYGALRPRIGTMSLAGGLVFGALFWLLIDEGANAALGLTPGPAAFPWQTHARGLAGHLAFGAVANTTLAAVQGHISPGAPRI